MSRDAAKSGIDYETQENDEAGDRIGAVIIHACNFRSKCSLPILYA